MKKTAGRLILAVGLAVGTGAVALDGCDSASRRETAMQWFGEAEQVRAWISERVSQGFQVGQPSAAVVRLAFGDEGCWARYLVTQTAEKAGAGRGLSRRQEVLSTVVTVDRGVSPASRVRVVDSATLEHALGQAASIRP